MKSLFQTGTREEYLNILVLFLRITIAAFMITHGWPKLSKLMAGGEIQFGDPIGLGPTLSLVLVVFSEFVCSIFIGIGLGTRLASIPLITTMLVAAFISHGPDPFGRKEIALLYLLFYLTLLVIGSRKYSIDYLLTRKTSKSGTDT
jgi:putative oxidoreductase